MRTTYATSLLLTLLIIAGCGGGKPESTPVPTAPAAPVTVQAPQPVPRPLLPAPDGSGAPTAPAPTPTPPPPLPTNPWEAELCRSTAPREERQQRLQTLVGEQVQGRQVRQVTDMASSAFPSCVALVTVGNEEGVLVLGTLSPRSGVFAWPVNGQWRVVPISPPGGDWSFIYSLTPAVTAFPGGSPSLILVGQAALGDGHQVLLRGRLGSAGALELTVVSDAYRAATLQVLQQDLVLVIQPGPGQEKVAWKCADCSLMNHHLLLRWNGDRYTKVAERVFHDPYDTVNLFVGALQSGRTDEAARYVSNRGLLGESLKALGTLPWAAERSLQLRETALLESRNWDALPREWQTPESSRLQATAVVAESGSQEITFQLVRQQNGWVVASVHRR